MEVRFDSTVAEEVAPPPLKALGLLDWGETRGVPPDSAVKPAHNTFFRAQSSATTATS